jgi:hypothetical protein
MPSSSSGAVRIRIQLLMLDWFSRWRIKDEQDQEAIAKQPGEVLPEYLFRKPDGGLIFLASANVLVLLGGPVDPSQAYFLERLRTKFAGVRGEPTRLLVVTRSEHLSTVVALGGDLPIVTDETGEAMLDLWAGERPVIFRLGPGRVVRSISCNFDLDDVPLTCLRPAA